MSETDPRARFEAIAGRGAPAQEAARLAAAVRAGDASAATDLAALWMHAAAASPGMLAPIYDASAQGWTGHAPKGPTVLAEPASAPIPAEFWTAFWAIIDDQETGRDALAITQRTAALSGGLDVSMTGRIAQAALAWPEVARAAADGEPERFTLAALAAAPQGSLGAEFHSLIVDNGFDLEVLDRDELGLSALPAPLAYLNARILQCHDLWHITGGYRTTALHEIAISGFQAGQFGHHYSSMFLAMVLARTAFAGTGATTLMLDVILSAWTHGRESPSLIGVDWPAIWDRPVGQIRLDLGLAAYASPYPADLFEQLRAA